MSRSQRGGTPTAVNLSFLDRSRCFFFQVASHLWSRGWVGPVPDPLVLWKSGSARNRTRDFWVCSEELSPLDQRGRLYSYTYVILFDKNIVTVFACSCFQVSVGASCCSCLRHPLVSERLYPRLTFDIYGGPASSVALCRSYGNNELSRLSRKLPDLIDERVAQGDIFSKPLDCRHCLDFQCIQFPWFSQFSV
jgi:hypothetical protein